MKSNLTTERLTILSLARMAAHNKLTECRNDLDDLENKRSIILADGAGLEEKENIKNEIYYMNNCVSGWKETLDIIRDWEDEITQ